MAMPLENAELAASEMDLDLLHDLGGSTREAWEEDSTPEEKANDEEMASQDLMMKKRTRMRRMASQDLMMRKGTRMRRMASHQARMTRMKEVMMMASIFKSHPNVEG